MPGTAERYEEEEAGGREEQYVWAGLKFAHLDAVVRECFLEAVTCPC